MNTYDLPRSRATVADLVAALRDSHDTTLRCMTGYEGESWLGTYLPIVNPPLWEVGHVGWFLERWCLRGTRYPEARSLMANADRLYDSMRIAHAARWFLPLPEPQATLDYVARVTDIVLERADCGALNADEAYYIELSLYHQDMHNEAFTYTRQTLGGANPASAGVQRAETVVAADAEGDVAIPAGVLSLGSTRDDGWVFDNEKWAHEVDVPSFAIARRTVTNAEFLDFVEDGGYRRRELWSDAGWRWREEAGRSHPVYWRRSDSWQHRVFDQWQPLAADLPVVHVSAHEAEAWCRWAGRRLPTEAEWERAAATAPDEPVKRCHPWGDEPADATRANLDSAGLVAANACPAGDSGWGCRLMLGNVWEWTSTAFEPYPGFAVDPYEDYSRPWFGNHRVLRGGSFATKPRIARNAYRNFYAPDRADVFCGFRTCALNAE